MNRCAFWIASFVALSPCVLAQTLKSSMLRPVTGHVRDAGVYHLGAGTWTRRVNTDGATALDIIYSNTCPTGYFAQQLQNEYVGDEGRIPGPTGPVLCDTGLLSTNAGCHCHYDVSAFQIGYCTGLPAGLSFRIGFQSAYSACAAPATTNSFTLSGLPGSPSGAQTCWLITMDLGDQAFQLAADGSNCTWSSSGVATDHLFGWTFENLNATTGTGSSFAGPLIAGNGGPFASNCSMVDNTRWDTLTCPNQGGGPDKWPNNLGEDGFGMDTQDRFRDDSSVGGPVSPPSGAGCYFFGGNPVGSFHLRLFSNTGCSSCTGCNAADVCVPGVGGVLDCPCSNAQVPAGSARGCNNSANTGGALLTSSGSASLTGDSLHFASAFQTDSASSILVQGQLPLNSGVKFGQGVFCITNGLLRLYLHSSVAGTVAYPQGSDTPVHVQSTLKGDAITSGATRLYAVYYRDTVVSGTCTARDTYNVTQTQSLTWSP